MYVISVQNFHFYTCRKIVSYLQNQLGNRIFEDCDSMYHHCHKRRVREYVVCVDEHECERYELLVAE